MPSPDSIDEYLRWRAEQRASKAEKEQTLPPVPVQTNPQPQANGFPIGKVLLIGSLLVFIAVGKLASGGNDKERREQQYRDYQKQQATMVIEKMQKGLPVSESEKKALEEYVHGDAMREVEKKYSR